MFRDSLLTDCYGETEEIMAMIKRINPEKGESIILGESYSVMRIMFNEHKNPRKPLLMISRISKEMNEENRKKLLDKYVELTVDFHTNRKCSCAHREG